MGHWSQVRCKLLPNRTITLVVLISALVSCSKIDWNNYKLLRCSDAACQEVISHGYTINKYPSLDDAILSFKKDVEVQIFGKTFDNLYYLAEINNVRGFVPSKFVKETNIVKNELQDAPVNIEEITREAKSKLRLKRDPAIDAGETLEVSDEPLMASSSSPLESQASTATPLYAQKLTVIDGTTLHEDLLVTATPSPTYSAEAVTKTATIEANFTEISESSVDAEPSQSEVNKEHENIVQKLMPAASSSVDASSDVDSQTKLEQSDQPTESVSSQIHTKLDDESSMDVSVTQNDTEEDADSSHSDSPSKPIDASNVSDTPETLLNTNSSLLNEHVEVASANTEKLNEDSPEENKVDTSNQSESILEPVASEIPFQTPEVMSPNDLNTQLEQDIPLQSSEVASSNDSHPQLEQDIPLQTSEDLPSNNHPEHSLPEIASTIEPVVISNNVNTEMPQQDTPIFPNPDYLTNNNDASSMENVPSVPLDTPQSQPSLLSHANTGPPSGAFANPSLNTQPNLPRPSKGLFGRKLNSNPSMQPVGEQEKQNAFNGVPDTEQKSAEIELNDASNKEMNSALAGDSQQVPTLPPPSLPPIVKVAPHQVASENYSPEAVLPDSPNQSALPTNTNSDVIVEKGHYAPTNSNLLPEKMGFVSVMMEVMPDELALFLEGFMTPLLMRAFVLVAFFWYFAKISICCINSIFSIRKLRGTYGRCQRKLNYFATENSQLKDERDHVQEMVTNLRRDIALLERLKYQLEQDNDKIKSEVVQLRKDNAALKGQAESAPQISCKLDTTLSDLEKANQENGELVLKIEELEEQIESQMASLNNYQKLAKSDKDEINDLNKKLKILEELNEDLKQNLKDVEENVELIQQENINLKVLQNKLSEENKNLKDDLLSAQESAKHFEDENVSLELHINTTKSKLSLLEEELEKKNAEIISMQTLLGKLNQNINKEHTRRQMSSSSEINGDAELTDGVNGDLSTSTDSNEVDCGTKTADDSVDYLQDIVQLQLRLTQAELEKKQVQDKLDALQKEVNDWKALIEQTRTDNIRLKEETEAASKERLKAVTELEVLTKYYKGKELEYAKDIGIHRLKQEQQDEDVVSMSSKLEVVQEENDLLKKQMKSIKKELEETERRYKSQLNQLEKQSHENWIAARNAERKFEESRAEATALRQTLSLSVKSPPPANADLSLSGYLDDTASSISSLPDALNNSLPPLPLPPPPPPLPFMPMLPPLSSMPLPANQPTTGPNGPWTLEGGESGPNSGTFWNSPAASIPQAQPLASAPNSTTTALYPSDSSRVTLPAPGETLVFPQPTPVSGSYSQSHYASPMGHSMAMTNTASGQSGSFSMPAATTANPYQYAMQPSQQSYSGQWNDMSRHTYSPALSQRSTHTPLTSLPGQTVPTPSVKPTQSTYEMANQQPQQYAQPQVHSSFEQSNTAGVGHNPYSISNYHSQLQSHEYNQTSSGYNMTPATITPSHSMQVYAPGQTGAEQNQYPRTTPHVNDSNSRPASVHTQMV